jgi:hypothetical protein
MQERMCLATKLSRQASDHLEAVLVVVVDTNCFCSVEF